MEKTKPARDFSELSALASRLTADADWELEELRTELRDGGVDPDRLVRNVTGKLQRWREAAPDATRHGAHGKPAPPPLPLVNQLRRHTGMSAAEIAKEVGVTVSFLSLLERHAENIPYAWRTELAVRSEQGLGVPREVVIGAFDYRPQLRPAAFEESLHTATAFDYEDILTRSGMEEPAKQVWRALAEGSQ
ncbi:MAG: hypothetical protein M3441_21795 [Chloroflexota bacterium]|nr:hypothetical protein [Chloroflexota bacterium]